MLGCTLILIVFKKEKRCRGTHRAQTVKTPWRAPRDGEGREWTNASTSQEHRRSLTNARSYTRQGRTLLYRFQRDPAKLFMGHSRLQNWETVMSAVLSHPTCGTCYGSSSKSTLSPQVNAPSSSSSVMKCWQPPLPLLPSTSLPLQLTSTPASVPGLASWAAWNL